MCSSLNAVKVSLDFDYVWGKYHQENAKNGIPERLDCEIFWGSMPPIPPSKTHSFGAAQLPRLSESLGTALESIVLSQNLLNT